MGCDPALRPVLVEQRFHEHLDRFILAQLYPTLFLLFSILELRIFYIV